MSPVEFDLAFKKFEDSFGKYSDMMRSRIRHFCSELSKYEFEMVIQSFVDMGIRKPTVADFKSKASWYKQKKSGESEESYEIKCEVCLDTGLIECKPPGLKASIFAGCPCYCGQNNKWGIPILTQDQSQTWALITQKQFISKWKPKTGSIGAIWNLAEAWNEKVRISKQFFAQTMEVAE